MVEDVPEMNYLVDDKNSKGDLCPRGEICIRGPGVFLYFKILLSKIFDYIINLSRGYYKD